MKSRQLLIIFALAGAGSSAAEPSVTAPIGHHIPGPLHQHHQHSSDRDSPFAAAISVGYDSRYVSEGRDNLDGDALLHGSLEFSAYDFLLGVWYADSPDNPYNEANLWIEYGFALGDVDLYVGFNHLRFPDDNAHDNEIGLGLSYGELPWGLSVGLDAYYSFDADGVFIEGSLTRDFTPCDWLTLEPGVVLGWNEGYVSSGHRGANHVAALISAIVPLGGNVDLATYVSYNFAIDSSPLQSPDDQSLGDFFYGGLSLNFAF